MGELTRRQHRTEQKLHDDGLNENERKALRTIRREAKEAGSLLSSDGRGGLPPSTVLGILRRDAGGRGPEFPFKCKVCGEKGTKENGGIGLHHRGGILSSRRMSREGHDNKGLVSICRTCHDKLHTEARKEGVDSSQRLPEGDRGTRRDHHDKPVGL